MLEGGEKCSFTGLAFHPLWDALRLGSWYFFCTWDLLRTCLWSSNPVPRAWGRGRQREEDPRLGCGTPAAPLPPNAHAHTHPCNPLPANFLPKPAAASAQRMLPRSWGRQPRAQATCIPTRRLASPALVAPARPRTDTRGKKHMHRLLRNASCNSNDKVITET